MQPRFDAFEYTRYLLSRWKFTASCCVVAIAVAVLVSVMLPKRYTATASIMIDAPAGNDPRAATAISPMYLESLRTYERFADSDTLFQRAMERFGLRAMEGETPAATLKKRILRVSKLRDTRVLEIQVTLRDPVKAQAVVHFLADETVAASRSLSQRTEDEIIFESRKTVDAARARVEAAEKASADAARKAQPESLQAELEGAVELRNRVRRELMDTEAELASQTASKGERGFPLDPAELRARRDALLAQSTSLATEIQKYESLLGERRAELERVEAERRSTRSVYDATSARLNEVLASSGSRGERLHVVDPGVVPERPSSPNLPLNVIGALIIALVGSALYVTVAFAHRMYSAASEFRSAYDSVR